MPSGMSRADVFVLPIAMRKQTRPPRRLGSDPPRGRVISAHHLENFLATIESETEQGDLRESR
jgi:hypothetical protein